MLIKPIIVSIVFFVGLTGCQEAANQNPTAADVSVESTEDGSLRRTAPSSDNPEVALSCLQQCGQEARGTVYADCLADGGVQQECGIQGRQWYRICLETRCDESAIQQDDCRTDCRLDSKEQYSLCVTETGEEQNCRKKTKGDVRACIAECE